jgi:hypothetical protein
MISSGSQNLLQRLRDYDWAAVGWWIIAALGKMSTIPVVTDYETRAGRREEARSLLRQCEELWSLPERRESDRGGR